jgi:hypothetical protein
MSTPIRRTRSTCWARAVSGHAVADTHITLMKSRRRITFTKGLRQYPALEQGRSNQETATSGIGLFNRAEAVRVLQRRMSGAPRKRQLATKIRHVVKCHEETFVVV